MTKQIPVQIVKVDEPYGMAELADGSFIRVRTVIMSVHQVMNDDETPLLNADGSLMYAVGSQTISQVVTAEEMKQIKNKRN